MGLVFENTETPQRENKPSWQSWFSLWRETVTAQRTPVGVYQTKGKLVQELVGKSDSERYKMRSHSLPPLPEVSLRKEGFFQTKGESEGEMLCVLFSFLLSCILWLFVYMAQVLFLKSSWCSFEWLQHNLFNKLLLILHCGDFHFCENVLESVCWLEEESSQDIA